MSELNHPYIILTNESDQSLYFINLENYEIFYRFQLPIEPMDLDITTIHSGSLSKIDPKIAVITSPTHEVFMTVDLGGRTPVLRETRPVNFPITSISCTKKASQPTFTRAVGVGTIQEPGAATYFYPGRRTVFTDHISGECVFLGSYVDPNGMYFLVTDYTAKNLTLYWLQDNGSIQIDHILDTYTQHPIYVDGIDDFIFVLTEEGTLYAYQYTSPTDFRFVTQAATDNNAHSFAYDPNSSLLYVLSENNIEVFQFHLDSYLLTKSNSFRHGGIVNTPIGVRSVIFNSETQKLIISLSPHAKIFDSNGTLLKELDNITGEIRGIAEFERDGIIQPNEILLATTNDDILYQIDTNTLEPLSETLLQNPDNPTLYPPLNSISIAAQDNGTNCIVMGKEGWYAEVYTGAQQPYVTSYQDNILQTHNIQYGINYLIAAGGYYENNGIVLMEWIDRYHLTDLQGFEECGLIYTINYHTNRIQVYAVGYNGYINYVFAGEIQDKKAHAEIMVDESPINITSISENNFLLVACYDSNKVDVIDISNINNICIPLQGEQPCPPEHGYFGVAHFVATHDHPQSIIYNDFDDKVFVLTDDYVEIYTFDPIAKTLVKYFEFLHHLTINPVYGVNQIAISKNGTRVYVLGSGTISVFNTRHGEFIQNISGDNFTSIFIY